MKAGKEGSSSREGKVLEKQFSKSWKPLNAEVPNEASGWNPNSFENFRSKVVMIASLFLSV